MSKKTPTPKAKPESYTYNWRTRNNLQRGNPKPKATPKGKAC